MVSSIGWCWIPLNLISFADDNKVDPANEVENIDAISFAVGVISVFAIESGTSQRSENKKCPIQLCVVAYAETKLYGPNYMHVTWFIC